MAAEASSSAALELDLDEELYGAESGWVEARTSCDHLASLSSDLSHMPHPNSPCAMFCFLSFVLSQMISVSPSCSDFLQCDHPAENWLCLSCKDVLCSRFINKHMLLHHEETGHCIALSLSDLSVWCFACGAYLDAQAFPQLRAVYEVAHLLKFGQSPPSRTVICSSSSTD